MPLALAHLQLLWEPAAESMRVEKEERNWEKKKEENTKEKKEKTPKEV